MQLYWQALREVAVFQQFSAHFKFNAGIKKKKKINWRIHRINNSPNCKILMVQENSFWREGNEIKKLNK